MGSPAEEATLISASEQITNNINQITEQINSSNANRLAVAINERNIQANEEAATTAYERQRDLNTTAYNRSEQSAVNAWKRSEQSADNAYQRMLEQWFRETEYNSPYAQMERYRQAGLNPAVMMSGQSSIASSTPSVPAASSPSASASPGNAPQASFGGFLGTTPYRFSTMQSGQAMANVYSQLARAEKDFSDAGRSKSEMRQIDNQMSLQLRNMEADALGKEILNDFLPFIQHGQIEKTASEVFTLFNQAIKANADAQVSVAEKALKDAQSITEKWRSQEQKVLAQTALGRIQSQIDLNKANAENARANASLTSEERSQLKDMHFDNVRMRQFLSEKERFNRDILGFEFQKLQSTIGSQIAMLKNNKLASDRELSILEQQLRKAKVDNDLRAYHEVLDALERINNGVTNWIPFAPDKTTRQDVVIDHQGKESFRTQTIYKSRW